MTNHFLHYWVPQTAAHELEHRRSPFSIGSNQLSPRKIRRDDTIWLVTVEKGALLLLGRVIVDEVIEDRDLAVERLGTTDLWEAAYTVVAQPDTVEPLNPVDITPIADELTFQSKDAPRLKLVGGRVNAQQLQSTRRLTPQSANLLEECWETAEEAGEADEARP